MANTTPRRSARIRAATKSIQRKKDVVNVVLKIKNKPKKEALPSSPTPAASSSKPMREKQSSKECSSETQCQGVQVKVQQRNTQSACKQNKRKIINASPKCPSRSRSHSVQAGKPSNKQGSCKPRPKRPRPTTSCVQRNRKGEKIIIPTQHKKCERRQRPRLYKQTVITATPRPGNSPNCKRRYSHANQTSMCPKPRRSTNNCNQSYSQGNQAQVASKPRRPKQRSNSGRCNHSYSHANQTNPCEQHNEEEPQCNRPPARTQHVCQQKRNRSHRNNATCM